MRQALQRSTETSNDLLRLPSRICGLLLGIATLATSASAAASTQWVYTPLPSIAGSQVYAYDVNNSGQIVGSTCNVALVCSSFVYANGRYTLFDPPTADANGSFAVKINNAGAVLGIYNDATSGQGVSYLRTGDTYTAISFSTNLATSTNLLGLSNTGAVSGGLYVTPSTPGPVIGDGVVRFTPDGPVVQVGHGNVVWGVNSAGQYVYNDSGVPNQRSFINSGGVSTQIVVPNAVSTGFADLNDAGDAVGSYRTGARSSLNGVMLGHDGSVTTFAPRSGGNVTIYGISDLGQMVGSETHGLVDNVQQAESFLLTLANLPTQITANSFLFNVAVVANATIFIDPLVAVGYDYATGAGDPNFRTVRLPVGVGDDQYRLILPDGTAFDVGGGQLFDFTTHGYLLGLDRFSVRGIETSAMLDPTSGQAFVTGLTFVADGRFTGSMTAVVAAVAEPEAASLMALGLGALGWKARRRRPAVAA